jgi:hypothetical protein
VSSKSFQTVVLAPTHVVLRTLTTNRKVLELVIPRDMTKRDYELLKMFLDINMQALDDDTSEEEVKHE